MKVTGKTFHANSLWSGRASVTPRAGLVHRLNIQELFCVFLFLNRKFIIVLVVGFFFLILSWNLSSRNWFVPFSPGSALRSSNREQAPSSSCRSALDKTKSSSCPSYFCLPFPFPRGLVSLALLSVPLYELTSKLFPSHPVPPAVGGNLSLTVPVTDCSQDWCHSGVCIWLFKNLVKCFSCWHILSHCFSLNGKCWFCFVVQDPSL